MRASAFSWKGQEFEGSDGRSGGRRVGSYIGIETKWVPCEFIENLESASCQEKVRCMFHGSH